MSRDRGPDRRGFQRRSSAGARILIGSLIVIAVLHLARPVVIPIALAVLFAFLFRPVVSKLERTFLRRTGAVVVTLAVAVGVVVLSVWALTVQLNSLVREFASYSGNLERKLHHFRPASGGSIALIERTLQRLAQTGQPQERPDMKVRVIPEPKGFADRYRRFAPTFEFLASAFLVIVLLFFLLRDREQFRD
ncbi:MAG TPA: AI-2E family transporter, partial [Thermoanaerobaculia bacterium]